MRQISPMGAGRASSMTLRINGIQPDELRPQSLENRDKQTLAQMQQRSEKHAVQTPVQSAANVGNPPFVLIDPNGGLMIGAAVLVAIKDFEAQR